MQTKLPRNLSKPIQSTLSHPKLSVVHNAVAKSKGFKKKYVADEVDKAVGASMIFQRPIEKGYLINWKLERNIWDRIFSAEVLKVDPRRTALCLTRPLFNPQALDQTTFEVVYEEYGFASLFCCTSAYMGLFNERKKRQPSEFSSSCAHLVIDSGFSYSHVVPFYDGKICTSAVKRLNVGGKVLTNFLKEVISYRHWNMMEETQLINHIKEKLCYVSYDLRKDLEQLKNPNNDIVAQYVLPDYQTNQWGYIKGEETENMGAVETQILKLGNERVLIPEILFQPSDIGLEQCGIAETVVESLKCVPSQLTGIFLGNMMTMGGNTMFKGFSERFTSDLQKMVSSDHKLSVFQPENPLTCAFEGASQFCSVGNYRKVAIPKQMYEEKGHLFCSSVFSVF